MLPRKPSTPAEMLGEMAWPPAELSAPAVRATNEPRGVGPQSVGIVGAGMMGVAIAAATAMRNLRVVVTDADSLALASAGNRVLAELREHCDLGSHRAASLANHLVTTAKDLGDLGTCDLVIESVPENLKLKQSLYAQLESHLGPDTLLASNTSTIPIARLAENLTDPGRFCGIHFFHPVRQRPLVEIIRGPKTRPETIASATAYAHSIAKMPIVVDDGPGFLVNRLLVPYLTEALEILLDGATIDEVERTARQFGMAIGPLALLDQIGIDTVLSAGRVLWDAFPDRVIASPLLITMYKSRRLGRKTGHGFFHYPDAHSEGQPDPQVETIIATWARPVQRFTQEQITARLLLPMVLEATRLLEEGKVHQPQTIDLAMVHGLGFPAGRGGLLHWADTLGAARLLKLLKPLESLGVRMQPTQLLKEMAQQRQRFYPAREVFGQIA